MLDLDKLLPEFDQALANHFVYGVATAVVAAGAAHWRHLPVPGACFLAGVFAGAAKEAIDALENWLQRKAGIVPTHSVDLTHALATAVGGACCALSALAAT